MEREVFPLPRFAVSAGPQCGFGRTVRDRLRRRREVNALANESVDAFNALERGRPELVFCPSRRGGTVSAAAEVGGRRSEALLGLLEDHRLFQQKERAEP